VLQQGIIRPSSSAFSLPVVLVNKHDSLWCFCMDYHTLKTKTMHDMVPTLVVDELLDELCDARFFTLLDLRSSYHQVCMDTADIENMFQTHHGHFEYFVTQFSLTNMPATIQALMNDVL
jgi:hypothetical protein